MEDWIDYYDSTHTIYVSRRHRDVHFRVVADEIAGLVPSPDAVVLDYACGEALEAGRVAAACGRLILAEPAPGVRARLASRFGANPKISVFSLEALSELPEGSVDLAVMNSVAQYMTPAEFDTALAGLRRVTKTSGRLVLGDVIPPDVGMAQDVRALLRFAAGHGFLKDAFVGLARTAFSDYRQLRSRIGLQTYSEPAMLARLKAAGFDAQRQPENLGHNPWRMTFEAQPKPS